MAMAHVDGGIPSVGRHEALKTLRVSDICLAFYAISSIAFDDGALVTQLSRIAIVAGAFTELGKNRFKLTGYHAWLIVFASIVFLSRFWAFDVAAATSIFTTVFFNLVCLACVAFLLYQDDRRIHLVMGCMVVAPLVLEVRVILAGGFLAFLSSRSVDTISANTVGMFSAFAVFMAFAFYREKRSFCWMYLALINACIALLSASRKAMMVLALVALLVVIFDSESRNPFGKATKVAVALAFLCLAVILVMNVPFLYELIGVRIEGMINGFFGVGTNVDSSTKTRMNLVAYGIEWFTEKPILGYGGDNFRALMAAYQPWQTAYYAHNNYVELLVSYGLVGTAVYYFLYVQMAVKGFMSRKRLSFTGITMLCLLVGLIVMDYGMVEYYSRDAQLFIVLAWTVLVGCENDTTRDDV